jgi:malate permease and related proteins
MNPFQIFERVLAVVVPVFLIAGIGFAYAKFKAKQAVKQGEIGSGMNIASLNVMMLDILAPLLVFTALSDKGFNLYAQRWVIAGGLMVVIGSGLVAWLVAAVRGYDIKSFVSPAMFNNCGNMGLPLAVFAYGQEGLIAAIALFTASNLMHFTLGVKILSPKANLLDVLKTPLTAAMVLGLLSNATHVYLPQAIFEGLKLLGQASIPVMLFMLGIRMAQTKLNGNVEKSDAGLVCAIINPTAGMAAAYAASVVFPLTGKEFAYVLMFASLPPAVLNALMAVQYKANLSQTMSAVVWGHLLSLISVPIAVAIGFAALG